MVKINTLKRYEKVKDYYYIDNSGDVWSDYKGKLKKISQKPKTGGYLVCCLKTTDNKKIYPRVHRLVALAYVPNDNEEEKIYVNHINENRTCNKSSNLEWVTPKGNNLWSLTKEIYVYDLNGKFIKKYTYTRECLEDGFNQGHVCACAREEERSHKGYVFSYKPLTPKEVGQRLAKTFYTKGKRFESLYKKNE